MNQNSFFQPLAEKEWNDILGEIDATEEMVKRDIDTLKEWIRKQPHLPTIEDDEWLLSFLLTCKNSLQTTKTRIDTYYTAKTLMPDVFQNRDPSTKEMESTFRYGTYVPCPKLTSDGYRIVIFHIFGKSDEDIPTVTNFTKMVQINMDMLLKMDRSKGLILIYNLGNCTSAIVKITIPMLKTYVSLATKVTPRRQRKVYIVNAPSFVDALIRFVKSLISKKMNDRIETWNDKASNLANVLPKEILPVDFGGEEKSLEELRDKWYEEIKHHRDWLIAGEKEVADLDKKPAQVSSDSAQFGLDGSFRSLSLD